MSTASPDSAHSLGSWPDVVLEKLCGGDDDAAQHRKTRLHDSLCNGAFITSDYSGLSGERELLAQMGRAMHLRYDWGFGEDCFEFCRACDFGTLQQTVLIWSAKHIHNNSSCVFGDINQRLPQHATNLLDACMPSATASVEQAAAAYTQMQAWLLENRAVLFNNTTVSYCHAHQKLCSAYPPPRFLDERMTKKPRFAQHEPPHFAKMRCAFAGTTCRGWSLAGNELRFADQSERPHAIWAAERQARAEECEEDVFFQECTPRYPWQTKLQAPMQASHQVLSIVWGPEMMGWPIRRTRRFCAGVNRHTMVYVGPENYEEEFNKLFGCDMLLNGDVFLMASPEQLQVETVRRARLRGVNVTEGSKLQLHQLLPPGQLLRLEAHKTFKAEADGEFASDTWFADLEQWLGSGSSTPGILIPCQLTHGSVFAWSRDGFVHPLELLQAHGFNVFEQTSCSYGSALQAKFEELTNHQLQVLCGNGWHLPAVACWVMFILANVIRIDKLQDIRVDAALHHNDGDDDGEEQGDRKQTSSSSSSTGV